MPIVLLTALGAVLRFVGIGHQGFWYDESYSAYLVRYDPGRMLGQLPHIESTPPLYYCVAWVWVRVFGDGSAGLRSLSAVCGVLTIPVLYACARKLHLHRRSALIAAALAACNPFLIWYSQEARAYSMLVLLCACSLLAYAWARERPRPLTVTIWALISVLALTTHYYAALIVVPEALWLLYVRRHARAVRWGVAAVCAAGCGLLPLLITQSHSGNDDWIGHVSLLTRLEQVPTLFLIGTGTHLRALVKYLSFAAVLVGLGTLVWRSRRRERQAAVLPGLLALAGSVIAVTVGEQTFLARNLLPIWVPALLVLAAGLGASRARLTGLTATVVLCATGVFATISVASDYQLQRPAWQKLTRALGPWPADAADDDAARVVVVLGNPGGMPLGFYMPSLRYVRTPTVANVRDIDVIAVRRKHGLAGFCWWGAACNLVSSSLPSTYDIPGFHVARRLQVEQFEIVVLRATDPVELKASLLPSTASQKHQGYVRSGSSGIGDAHLVQPG